MKVYRKWIKRSLLVSVVVFLLVIVFNFIVDPYGVFNVVSVEGFNKNKSKITTDQLPRFYAAKQTAPENMIFGTSRVGVINPLLVSAHNGAKTYNFSLTGSTMILQKHYIDYFLEHYHLKSIIIGLDFFSFMKQVDSKDASMLKRLNNNVTDDYLLALLSKDTLSNSINTIGDNIGGRYVVTDYETGQNIYQEYKEKFKQGGSAYTQSMIRRTLRDYDRDYYQREHFDEISIRANVALLKDIYRAARKKEIDIRIYVNPVYYLQFALIKLNGLENKYLFWKKELAKVTDYYDFSGYNSVTTDPVHWYDSSHFKEKIAEKIIKTLFMDEIDDGFGMLINDSNVMQDNQKMFEKISNEDLAELRNILENKE